MHPLCEHRHVRNPTLAAGMAVALAFAGATSCSEGPEKACTLIGCRDGLQVESTGLAPNRTIDVCIGDTCVSAAGGGLSFAEIVTTSPAVEVKVVVRENGLIVSEQRRSVPVTVLQPNGDDCPPRCRLVTVRVGPGGFR